MQLLPVIQNEEKNEDVTTTEGNKTTLTFTKLSMVAARTYLKIIGMNGAWGMGLIDVGSLNRISALVSTYSSLRKIKKEGARVTD